MVPLDSGRPCRGCGGTELRTVLDLGMVPAADYFPPVAAPVGLAETAHPLRMDQCARCALAQLAEDDTRTQEPRGIEPAALREQAADAVTRVAESGLLHGNTVREFGSPHGGTWVPLLTERGYTPADGVADVVLDCFGLMHEPDQRAAFAERAAATAPGGLLLIQFHSLATIVASRQWNALRHGHFAYYSLSALSRLLAAAGMSVTTAWRFDLYGGTVLVGARHGTHRPDAAVREILTQESAYTEVAAVRGLQQAADAHAEALRRWLTRHAAQGDRVFAYGAASRAVALFSLAGVDRGLIAAVADASPAKQGRRMPGTDVPIIAPDELVTARPDLVLLTLPDLLPEVRARYPELDGCWIVDDPADTTVRGG
ncbi:class I SAM-dependent methyltransferase [Nocardia suismassiliense]|uniref:class I SAM-dependent methyltransferase n=1 Tax=Nocardia suismassiliense TaxID=2077092 RepID=UPI000D1E3D89|nr:methyltransferase domain-containing protein [Nocardia suismassiliense]